MPHNLYIWLKICLENTNQSFLTIPLETVPLSYQTASIKVIFLFELKEKEIIFYFHSSFSKKSEVWRIKMH